MSNFTRSGGRAKIWQSITNLSCCSLDLITNQTRVMKAFAFVMLFGFSISTVAAQSLERRSFIEGCQDEAPAGPSEADVANLYLNQCGDTPAEVIKSSIMSGNDCDWTVEYTYSIKCGSFEGEIKIPYTGGDRTPPLLNEGAQVPSGATGLNLCFNQAPSGPKLSTIAGLYTDNCGEVLVEKFGSPQGDDCSWTANYKYTIMDTCGNMLADLDIHYSGGDTQAPQLNKGSEVPTGMNGLNLCYDQKPLGPTEAEIAALYWDNCGTVTVTKTLTTEKGNDDCKWLSAFEYTIQDDCGNFAEPIFIEYMGGDSEAPVLSGVPANTEVSCIDLIPAAANVTATDNCTANVEVILNENYDNLGLACEGGELVRTWSAMDLCGNMAVVGTQTIVVLPAPMAEFAPVSPETISCEAAFNFQVEDLLYSNGISKSACSIQGSVSGTVTPNFTLCGGDITVNWTYSDDCGRTINAEKVYTVTPAPAATLDATDNTPLSCEEASSYVAGSLGYSNGLEGDCSINGSIAPIQKNLFDACGGKITVNYIGEDTCGNPLSTLVDIVVLPAPAAEFEAIDVESELSCSDASGYVAAALNYSNGLEGDCSLDGSVNPEQVNDFDSCGGKITITWTGEDACGNPLSATVDINVLPAPEASVTTPELPTSIDCADAVSFTAGDATYTNGLTGDCEISGSLVANVVKEYDSCGGKITITYNGEDACGRPLSAGPFDVDVNPAPMAEIIDGPGDIVISCVDVDGFVPDTLNYSNGLAGTCEISGSVTGVLSGTSTICGGELLVTWDFVDECGRELYYEQFVTVTPAPEASFEETEHEDITCSEAANYEAGLLSYSNGLEGECGINGSVDGVLSGEFNSCGGLLFVDWTYTDQCGRTITARKQLKVGPAPEATLDTLEDEMLSCSDADSYQADSLYYTNGLEGTCNISGYLEPTQTNNFDECGGEITVTWSGEDVCGRALSASQTISVDPAPMAEFINPLPNINVTCDLADDYIVTNLAYSNGLEGTCGINGDVPGVKTGSYDACGGTLYVDWKFVDDCGREIEYRKTITVLPAPEASVTTPELPASIDCSDAAGYMAANASYTNGLTGLCEISGELEATIVPDYTVCGGKLTVTWSGYDVCQNPLSAGPIEIIVNPAPEASVTTPELPTSIDCSDAAGYMAANASYTNGLEGTCNISGELEATIVPDYTSCGGKLTVTWRGYDECQRPLSAGPIEIIVNPAPEASVTTPELPTSIDCSDAAGYMAANASYTNGLEGTCNISGELEATIVPDYTSCGGKLTVTWSGYDECQRPLSAGPIEIIVNPAPEASVTTPELPASIDCSDAAGYMAANASYTNGLEGTCNISGELEATIVPDYTSCGGKLTVTWSGYDECQRPLSAGPIEIIVNPAPEASVTTPLLPASIDCSDAAGYMAANASYTNGLEGTCNISGELEATIVPDYTSCGGKLTVTWRGLDECQRPLSAGPIEIIVNPAPEASVTTPELPTSIDCSDAAGYMAANASYTNGLEGTCNISGELEATIVPDYTSCGGKLTVTWRGYDECQRPLSAGPIEIIVNPAPEASVTIPELPASIDCSDAAGYMAANASYTNGLEGTCNISGELEATIVPDYTSCGGKLTVTWSGYDECQRPLSAGPIEIIVNPAPEASVTTPELPTSIDCSDAAGYMAANASYTNGLEGTCNISGELEATIVPDYTSCGGKLTVTWSGYDECQRPLSAGPIEIIVNPAPEASVTTPLLPTSIDCSDAAGYMAANASYTNGLEGTCNISGELEATIVPDYTSCGGKLTVTWRGLDECQRPLSAGPIEIIVNPAPEASVTTPLLPTSIDCSDAAGYMAANASYTNGLEGTCNISGELEATIVPDYTSCGGKLTVTWSGYDECQRPLSAGPIEIIVNPAPEASVTTPELPASIDCSDAAGYMAANASYTNGLEGTCNISGELEATIVPDYTSCGGKLTVTWSGYDECQRPLSAGPIEIIVNPAPEASVTTPLLPASIDCVDAAGYMAANASYTNGLEGTCNISGELEATIVPDYDACGGKLTVTWSGYDVCGRPLSAGPIDIEVNPAPAPVFDSIESVSIACEDLASYEPEFLGYSNGIDGTCGINGEVQGVADEFTGSCGTFEVHFSYVSCGVEITSKQTITVIDETAPILVGELPQGLSDVNACLSGAPAPPTEEEIEALFTDNCGNVNATLVITSPEENTDCLWAVLYRYTIVDDCGNYAAPVKIYHNGGDKSAPELVGNLPEGVTGLQCLSENPGAPDLGAIQDAYTDNCGDVMVTPFEPNIQGDDCGWTATYEYEIKDTCGNKLPNLVIVNSGADTMAPELDGEIPMGENTVNACKDSDLGEPTEEDIAALFSDNCTDITADNVTKIEKLAIGSDCEWIRVFEYIVKDDCGNVYPTFKVNYQGGDSEGPMATGQCTDEVMVLNTSDWDGLACPEDASLSLVDGDVISVDSEWTVGGIPAGAIGSIYGCYTDNCTAVEDLTFTVIGLEESKSDCSTTLTVTFDVEDSCGNKSADPLVCTFIINDTTAPELTCPAGEDFGTVTETPDFIDKATWTDNCQGNGETADYTDVISSSTSTSGNGVSGITFDCFYVGNSFLINFEDAIGTDIDGYNLYDVSVNEYQGQVNTEPYSLIFNSGNNRWELRLVSNAAIIAVSYVNTFEPSCNSSDWTDVHPDCSILDVICESGSVEEYTLVRTFTADDGCGNIGECETTYTWTIGQACDDVAPVLECPADEDFGIVQTAPTAFATSAPYSDEGNAGGTTETYSDVDSSEQYFGESTELSIGCIEDGVLFAVVNFVRTGFNGDGIAEYATGTRDDAPELTYELIYDSSTSTWITEEYQNGVFLSNIWFSPSSDNAPSCDPADWDINSSRCDSIFVDCGFAELDYTEYTKTRTFTATDDCGNEDTCDVVYTWVIDNEPSARNSSYTVGSNSDVRPLSLTGSKEESKIDFKAFPVPFDNEVTLTYEFDYRTDVTIEFFDTKGLLVLTETNTRYVAGSTGRTKLDLSRTSNQVFYVKLTTNQGSVTKKLVSSGK
ncbi:T9SS type A sorting domain-containing protein [Psychroserpens ponticola]|uniref:Gliding motility-associated C-terminal domain-containing protein n=1 Tax=Psychroserpens ponticola TaxID=2932268 RepID=A0ABY7RTF9_9FLAO|nr:hypothetical protein [Psychroserpens ponticola]WCO00384.1 hypothetical protein MUN68_009915 [Psychroserpens ponticola]